MGTKQVSKMKNSCNNGMVKPNGRKANLKIQKIPIKVPYRMACCCMVAGLSVVMSVILINSCKSTFFRLSMLYKRMKNHVFQEK